MAAGGAGSDSSESTRNPLVPLHSRNVDEGVSSAWCSMPSSNCVARKNYRNSAKNHRKHWESRSQSRFLERIKAKLQRTPFFRDGCKVGHRLGIGVHIGNAKLQLCCPKQSSKQCQKSPETLGMSIKIKMSGANSGRSGCNECAHLRPRPRRPRTCA